MSLHGSLQLAQALQTAHNYMFESAPWLLENPLEKIGAERQLQNNLNAAIQWGFALHDPLHPELRYLDRYSQYGLFNPDNKYYVATIDYPGEYIIRGDIGTVSDINIQVGAGNPGFNAEEINIVPVGLMTREDIIHDFDGKFEIVISPENDGGAINWISSSIPCPDQPGGLCLANSILIRESFMDWNSELGGSWYLERTDTRGLPSPIVDQNVINYQYDRASQHLINNTVGWVNFVANIIESLPPTLPFFLKPPSQGDDALVGQFNSVGIMKMTSDIAYVISAKKSQNATYQGIQVGDLWFNAFDYCRRQTSLTMDQAVPSSDEWYHFVFSERDPGVANWLDPSGATTVVAFLRWQGLDVASFPDDEIPTIKRVPFASIRSALPADEPVFTTNDRTEQLAARHAACLTKPRGYNAAKLVH